MSASASLAWRALVAALLCCGSAAAGAPPVVVEKRQPVTCRVRQQFGRLVEQQVTIHPWRIKGPDFNLHREGDVFYGFILSRPTRFRVADDEISGSAAGLDLMLHIFRPQQRLEITGLVGGRRVRARLDDNRVVVDAGASTKVASATHLVLERQAPGRLRGQFGQGGSLTPARMELAGCDLEFIGEQPGLVVVLFLWWLGA